MNNKIQTWFVTGASNGVGYEICEELLSRGYNVIAVSRRIPNFSHKNALCLSCDVRDENDVANVINKGIERFGKIDVVSNNAGISTNNIIEEETLSHMKEIMETNFFGTFNVVRAILPHFRSNKNGLIINNSSQSGLTPRPYGGGYCSSKHAIEGLTGVCFIETQNFCKTMIFELGFFEGTDIDKDQTALGSKKSDKSEYKVITHYLKPFDKFYINNLKKAIKLIINEAEKDHPRRRLILGKDAQIKVEIENKWIKKDLEYSKKISDCAELNDESKKLLKDRYVNYIKLYFYKVFSNFNKNLEGKLKSYENKIKKTNDIIKYS